MPSKAFFIRRLKAQQSFSYNELLRTVKASRERIAGIITGAANNKQTASSYRARETLYANIRRHYEKLDRHIDNWGKAMAAKTAKTWHNIATADLQGTSPRSITRFDTQRVKTYWQLIHPDNSQHLAAVATDRMKTEDIRSLRRAYVDVFRQSAIDGMTHDEMYEALQMRWNELAGNIADNRFVDSNGRVWDNRRYFQMLVRTTTARIARESYIDTIVKHGDDLMRIVNVGETCELCEAWSDLIISVSGSNKNFPSYQDAIDAGWGHPNCDCMLERVDEDIDADDIKAQSAATSPKDWDDVDKVAKYKEQFEE